jgi:hypothetical protein
MPSSSRIVLVAEDRTAAAGPHAAKVRRYRLARLRLVERRAEQDARHRGLTRTYD